MSSIKKVLADLLSAPWVARSLSWTLRDRASIFVLHRFRDPERGVVGIEPDVIRRALEFLRRERYALLSLEQVFDRLSGGGPPLDRAVAFTMDDGTIDQATVAAPLFAAFDCPVTTFVVTDYLDGRLWLWWDRIEHIVESTSRRELRVALGERELAYRFSDDASRARVVRDFTQRCKLVPDAEKLRAIARLAEYAEVEIPPRPPARYAPMSWSDLRACEARGMTFGAHTVTHPVLARTDDAQSHHEITASWARLCAEARRPVPIFCYPNGRCIQDFGAREVSTLRRAGFRGAVTSWPRRHAAVEELRRSPDAAFAVPRLDISEDLGHFLRSVSGVRRIKDALAQRSGRYAPGVSPAGTS